MNKNQILLYYRKYLKLATQFKSYNYQDYALRKIRFDFETKKSNLEVISKNYEKLNRIVLIQNLYYVPTLIPNIKN